MGTKQSKQKSETTTSGSSDQQQKYGGISLKFIMELSKQLKENDTMEDFVRKIIKPATKARNESYYQLLAREQPSKIKSTADHFISHVWSYKTKSELMASLKYTLLDQFKTEDDDVYVWLDGLCVNQHLVSGTKKASPEQLQQTFGESLTAIGSVVMVLANWQNPSYPKRIWCVFEAYMTKKIPNVKITLAMSPAEEKNLMDAMIENKINVQFLQQFFSSVDVESAKAKELEDQQAILQLIREFGVSDVNSVVLGNLKQWIVQGGDVALTKVGENTRKAGNICMARHFMYHALGEYDVGLEWAQKALDIFIKINGPEHQEVAISYINITAGLKELERLDEALVTIDKAFMIFNKILGADHPNTISARSWKAGILQEQGKFDDSLIIRDEVLQLRRRALGEDHPDTVLAMVYKARNLKSLKRYDEALPLYEQVIVISKRIYDGNHPEIASAINNKAQCLQEMGRPEEALSLNDQSMAIYKKVYGEIHPHVATSYASKAECLRMAGRFHDALPFYDQSLAINIKIYGQHHSTVAVDLNNKAHCLKALGRMDEAKQLGKQALEIAEGVLGSVHPETILFRKNWESE
jgi:tetratricopeptide (TPR) repeat protein